jgi:hypothetical protein
MIRRCTKRRSDEATKRQRDGLTLRGIITSMVFPFVAPSLRRFVAVLLVAIACLSAAPATAPMAEPSFRTLRVLVDPHGKPMAVWQVEVVAEGDVKLVGVEKGAATGSSDPPYYDPAAMAGGRIVIGAYSLEKDLPAGRTHVATLHVRVGGSEEVKCKVRVMTAGAGDGSPIAAEATVEEGVRP